LCGILDNIKSANKLVINILLSVFFKIIVNYDKCLMFRKL
jgi:hypothetical protein